MTSLWSYGVVHDVSGPGAPHRGVPGGPLIGCGGSRTACPFISAKTIWGIERKAPDKSVSSAFGEALRPRPHCRGGAADRTATGETAGMHFDSRRR